jgi:serine/threonine-protein kinase
MAIPTPTTDTADKPGALAPGAVVADRYKVLGLLGEGGMGAVYRAEHVHMRKPVALKVLHLEVSSQAEIVARFEREAVVAANIDHPNVAAATDFGRLDNGSFFLVLEYIDGRSLRDELAKGRLEPARALAILAGIVAGVRAAHDKGVVHRDLKPENVMLVERDGDRDFVKVLDFGIAKLDAPTTAPAAEPASGVQALTRMGMIYGTPDYMSPEQALGEPVDARTDLYALGIMFFEMLAGATPWKGSAVTQLRERLLAEAAPEMPDDATLAIDPRFRVLVRKLLARDKEARFQTAAEVARAIDELLAGAGAASARALAVASAVAVAPGSSRAPSPSRAAVTPPPRATAPTEGHAVAADGAAEVAPGARVGGGQARELSLASLRARPLVAIASVAGFAVLAGIVVFVVAGGSSRAGAPSGIVAAASSAGGAGASASSSASAARSASAAPSAPAAHEAGDAVDPPASAAASSEGPAEGASAAPSSSAPRARPAGRRPRHKGRREGPGGIYIPPPITWFK